MRTISSGTGTRAGRIRTVAISAWLEALLLLGAGALVVVVHQSFRYPLHLPGRQGVLWMAILLGARSTARTRWAGSIASVGAAGFSLLPLWGPIDDRFIWLTYLIPGLVVDAAFRRFPGLSRKVWFLAGLGAVAHVTKPLLREGIAVIAGWDNGSWWLGTMYPSLTHLLFGAAGGILAAGLVQLYRTRSDHRG